MSDTKTLTNQPLTEQPLAEQPLVEQLSLPVICAPMFLVSGMELVLAACKQGIVGTFPALNERTSDHFASWLHTLEQKLAKLRETQTYVAPYGINLVVHKSNPRWQADLEHCVHAKVPLVISSLGAAREVVDAVHSYGGLVYHDVASSYHAKKAIDAGVDGVIAVSQGAGGHAGTINPFALVGEIREFYQGTLLLGGSLSRGDDILAAQAMGADLAYLGTRFINCRESNAEAAYQQMLVDAGAHDIIHTPAVSGVPANFMRQSLEQAGFDMSTLSKPGEINYGEKLIPENEEARAWKTVWSAGQGVSTIHDSPSMADLVLRLKNEYQSAKTRLGR
ncbi:NAD(P)H-dependent flavin oxidoreductase [Thalassomonas haliotis]|uniref:NAD(P)H-dependent flavin oxidoreductase n=1 Tax=Thalassomonas haliotis TaxID=485448 RepID=UPI00235F65EB|nr:nitronate monooxygenase family protein [Thalassomonas haliotis]